MWRNFRQNTKTYISILKMVESRCVSMIPRSFISFQTLRLKVHEIQNNCNAKFFPNIKITGARDVQLQVGAFTFSLSTAGGYSHIVWVGCATGFAQVLPFTRPNSANFVTLYQTKTAQLFLISIFCKWDSILEQFSMITRPTRLNGGLKTIPFPAAHTRIANVLKYPPPPDRELLADGWSFKLSFLDF